MNNTQTTQQTNLKLNKLIVDNLEKGSYNINLTLTNTGNEIMSKDQAVNLVSGDLVKWMGEDEVGKFSYNGEVVSNDGTYISFKDENGSIMDIEIGDGKFVKIKALKKEEKVEEKQEVTSTENTEEKQEVKKAKKKEENQEVKGPKKPVAKQAVKESKKTLAIKALEDYYIKNNEYPNRQDGMILLQKSAGLTVAGSSTYYANLRKILNF